MTAFLGHLSGLLEHMAELHPALQFAVSAVCAAFTEEWSTVAVFGLARAGRVGWLVALGSVFSGTFSINVAFWYAGRLAGIRALKWKLFSKLQGERLDKLRQHVHREGWIAVAISRFVPGTRIPVFVLAGILGMDARTYILTQVGATLVWMLATLGLVHLVVELARHNPGLLAAGCAALVVAAIGLALRRRYRKAK